MMHTSYEIIEALKKQPPNDTVLYLEKGINAADILNFIEELREEIERLTKECERYDPFWFCTFGGCEGVCNDCKDTCEMSIFVKTRRETAERFAEMAREGAFVDFMGEPIIRASKIDEICKKISEGKK